MAHSGVHPEGGLSSDVGAVLAGIALLAILLLCLSFVIEIVADIFKEVTRR